MDQARAEGAMCVLCGVISVCLLALKEHVTQVQAATTIQVPHTLATP